MSTLQKLLCGGEHHRDVAVSQQPTGDDIAWNASHGIYTLEPNKVLRTDPVQRANPALQTAVVAVDVAKVVDAPLFHSPPRVESLEGDVLRPCVRAVCTRSISTQYAVVKHAI